MNAKTQAGPTRGIIVSRQVRARVLTWGPGPLLMWFPDGEQWDRGRLPDISLHRNRGIIDRKVVAQGKLLGVVRTIQEIREGKRQGRAERGNRRFFFLSSRGVHPAGPLYPRLCSSFIFPGHVKRFLFRPVFTLDRAVSARFYENGDVTKIRFRETDLRIELIREVGIY